MFISNSEKAKIDERLKNLETMVRDLSAALVLIKKKPEQEEKRKGRKWSEAERRAQSDRVKARWAEKKAKVAA